jgi:glucose-6-phosphate dehydrogenase assembly protein OpcA
MAIGETFRVSAGNIERELRNLWRHEAEHEQVRSGEPVVCARTLNLVVYPADIGDSGFLKDVMGPITTQHPSRAIVIEPMGREANSDFEARVSASCVSRQGAGMLGCELIMLRAKPCAYEKLRSVVVPLMVPDLPIFLWWRKPLSDDPTHASRERELFDGLAKLADRVVIDSAHLTDPAAQLHRLAEAIRARRAHAAFSDLAWARLTTWRQLVAQFFDGPAVSYADRITDVTVEYNAQGVVSPEPLLLAGWLASRLDWKPAAQTRGEGSSQPSEHALVRKGGEVRLRFERSQRAGADDVTGITIKADHGAAVFSVCRTQDASGLAARIEVTGQPPVQRVVRARDHSTAEMVSKELELLKHDVQYEEALNAAASLVGAKTR